MKDTVNFSERTPLEFPKGPLSGRVIVATAGVAKSLTTGVADWDHIHGPVAVEAFTTNTGLIYIGRNSAKNGVSSANGFALAAGDKLVFNFVENIAALWIDSTVNGEGLAWIALNVG